MLYILIVGDAAVLRNLLVESGKQQMSLIAFAEIRAVEQELEVRRALLRIVAASVEIVDDEADAEALS